MVKKKIYMDTSVFGGYFDKEFEKSTTKLFDEIIAGKYELVISTATIRELEKAPDYVVDLLDKVLNFTLIEFSDEIKNLRDAYISTGVLAASSIVDAEHIASATVAKVDIIVSWNFKHIVHVDKIRGYNAVNLFNGYGFVSIHNPSEVIDYEE